MSLIVNGERIDNREILAEIERLKPRHDMVFKGLPEDRRSEQLRTWAKDNVIERVLLRQAAGQTGVEAFIAATTAGAHPASESELVERYERQRDTFRTPEIVRASQLASYVTDDRPRHIAFEGITHMLSLLEKGTPFEEVARLYSDCPDNDGDLGFFPKGEMVEEFESAVFSMRPGELSEIIESPLGFHIATVHERRDGRQLVFSEVQELLRKESLSEQKERLLELSLDRLRSDAVISESTE